MRRKLFDHDSLPLTAFMADCDLVLGTTQYACLLLGRRHLRRSSPFPLNLNSRQLPRWGSSFVLLQSSSITSTSPVTVGVDPSRTRPSSPNSVGVEPATGLETLRRLGPSSTASRLILTFDSRSS